MPRPSMHKCQTMKLTLPTPNFPCVAAVSSRAEGSSSGVVTYLNQAVVDGTVFRKAHSLDIVSANGVDEHASC